MNSHSHRSLPVRRSPGSRTRRLSFPRSWPAASAALGADGVFGDDDDTEHEVTITAAEGLATEAWVQRSPEAR